MYEQKLKRFAILTAAAGLSTWAIDMADALGKMSWITLAVTLVTLASGLLLRKPDAAAK